MHPLSAADVAQSLYRLAQESREFALMTLDRDGVITWWSKGAEVVFGHRAADITGQPVTRIFTPEDIAAGADKQEREIAMSTGAAEDDRWQVRADGSRIFANGVLTALHDDAGEVTGFVKALRDRSDVREQLDRARNELAEAQSGSKRKDVFLGTLAHELRNPLGPLTGAAYLIRMAASPSVEVEQALKVIERQADVLKRLVDDLLDVARLGTGKVTLDLRDHDLRDLLALAVRSAAPGPSPDRAVVELHVPQAPVAVRADANRLQQVFGNLLGNALKFTGSAGHVWVKLTVEPGEAVVRFEDDGAGIAPETLPRIFDLFTQAEETRRMSPEGLGIGLALVRDLVTLHDGTVQVRSDGVGKGSEFTVRLPLLRTP